jgi:hypothetical protein
MEAEKNWAGIFVVLILGLVVCLYVLNQPRTPENPDAPQNFLGAGFFALIAIGLAYGLWSGMINPAEAIIHRSKRIHPREALELMFKESWEMAMEMGINPLTFKWTKQKIPFITVGDAYYAYQIVDTQRKPCVLVLDGRKDPKELTRLVNFYDDVTLQVYMKMFYGADVLRLMQQSVTDYRRSGEMPPELLDAIASGKFGKDQMDAMRGAQDDFGMSGTGGSGGRNKNSLRPPAGFGEEEER